MQRIPCPNLGIKWVILENSIQSILCDASMRIQPFCPDTVMKGTISISSRLHVQCHRAYGVFVCLCRSNVKASSLVWSSPVWRVFNNFGDNLSQQMHAWCHGRSSVESSTFSLTARFSRQIHTWITRKQQTHLQTLCIHSIIGFSRLVVRSLFFQCEPVWVWCSLILTCNLHFGRASVQGWRLCRGRGKPHDEGANVQPK